MTDSIQPSEYYDTSPATLVDASQKIIYVIDDPHINPADFYKNFRTYYGNQYEGKNIILIHNSGCHWTTYNAELKSSPTSLTTHEIAGDNRCSIHATAKALEIATGTTLGTSTDGKYHINNENDSGQIIHQLQLQNPNDELRTKIQNLANNPCVDNWLAGDDISKILINSSLTQNHSHHIFVASGHDSSKFNSIESIRQNWNNEIMELLCDERQWTGNKFSGTYDFPHNSTKKQYFEDKLSANIDRNEAIKKLLEKYSEFEWKEQNDGSFELQGGKDKLDKFNSLRINNSENFLAFVASNYDKFNDDSKEIIKATLRHIKISFMVNTGDKFTMPIREPERVQIIDSLDTIINQLDAQTSNLPPSLPLPLGCPEALTLPAPYDVSTSPIMVQSSQASIIQSTITKVIDQLKETKSKEQEYIFDDFDKTTKINKIDKSKIDPELLKKRKYVLVCGSGNNAVMGVASNDTGNLKFKKIRFDGYSDLALFSEYIKFAENPNENMHGISNLYTFKLQPPKFKGFGLKLNFTNNELFLEDCFNDDFKANLDSKKNQKIAEINDIKIADHIGIAQSLGIDEKIYFASLFRSSEKNIKLKFDGDPNVINLDQSKKAVFGSSSLGEPYKKIDNPTFYNEIELCKKAIDKTSLTIPSTTISSALAGQANQKTYETSLELVGHA